MDNASSVETGLADSMEVAKQLAFLMREREEGESF